MELSVLILTLGIGILVTILVCGYFWKVSLLGQRNLLSVSQEKLHASENRMLEYREEVSELTEKLSVSQQQVSCLESDRVALKTLLTEKEAALQSQSEMLQSVEKQILTSFKALSADTLRENGQSFVQLADGVFAKHQSSIAHQIAGNRESISQVVAGLQGVIAKVDDRVIELENARKGAYAGLTAQIANLLQSHQSLQMETSKLASVLKSPVARGQWGELQLRKVVEQAGMLSYCDFQEQETRRSTETSLRPDMVVKLPGNKNIVIDSKAPLNAFLEAADELSDEIRLQKLKEYTANLRRHVQQLSQKAYWQQFEPSPEFVVLFLPGETFFHAALQADPQIIELISKNNVVLAGPVTLIALLKTIAYGWRQETFAENTKKVGELGVELHERVADFVNHLHDVGKGLHTAVQGYNKSVGTLQSRVLVSARKLKEFSPQKPKKEIKDLSTVDGGLRPARDGATIS